MNVGTGVSVDRIFHRTFDEATNSNIKNNKRNENGSARRNAGISDPYVEFNGAYKALGLQNTSSVTVRAYTDSYFTDNLEELTHLSYLMC